MSHDQLKLSAQNMGFDLTWVADILEKFGPDVLALCVEAARHGISSALVAELLDKFGPALLQFIVELLNKKAMMAAVDNEGVVVPGPIIEGIDSNFIEVIVQKYLPIIIQQYLPVILEKYGPQLIQMLLDIFLKSLQK